MLTKGKLNDNDPRSDAGREHAVFPYMKMKNRLENIRIGKVASQVSTISKEIYNNHHQGMPDQDMPAAEYNSYESMTCNQKQSICIMIQWKVEWRGHIALVLKHSMSLHSPCAGQ